MTDPDRECWGEGASLANGSGKGDDLSGNNGCGWGDGWGDGKGDNGGWGWSGGNLPPEVNT